MRQHITGTMADIGDFLLAQGHTLDESIDIMARSAYSHRGIWHLEYTG